MGLIGRLSDVNQVASNLLGRVALALDITAHAAGEPIFERAPGSACERSVLADDRVVGEDALNHDDGLRRYGHGFAGGFAGEHVVHRSLDGLAVLERQYVAGQLSQIDGLGEVEVFGIVG